METKVLTTCFYFIWSFPRKQKRDLKPVPLPHFLHDFWRHILFSLYSVNWPYFIADRVYFFRYLAIYLLQLFVIQFVTSQIDLSFVIKLFSYITKTFRTKYKYQKRKELLRWNKTHYSWFLKGFVEVNITNFFVGWESDFKVIYW